jgi:Uma2 family endonuclease
MSRPATMTADELLRLNLPTKRTELVRGQLLVREPAGHVHGEAAVRLAAALVAYVYPRKLGRVYAAETGFKLETDPDTVRAPDVAFIRAERVSLLPPNGYPAMSPDLAVEVLSPDDRPQAVLQKVTAWRAAGSRLVWVVDPIQQTARVFRSDGTESVVSADGSLDGDSVLPGFSCALKSIC